MKRGIKGQNRAAIIRGIGGNRSALGPLDVEIISAKR